MRVGKATILLALAFCLFHVVAATAQKDSGFESLLNDIGKQPAAASTSAVPAQAPAMEVSTTAAAPVAEATTQAAPAAEAPVAAFQQPAPADQPAPAAQPSAPETTPAAPATPAAATDTVAVTQPVAATPAPAAAETVPATAVPVAVSEEAAPAPAVVAPAPAPEAAATATETSAPAAAPAATLEATVVTDQPAATAVAAPAESAPAVTEANQPVPLAPAVAEAPAATQPAAETAQPAAPAAAAPAVEAATTEAAPVAAAPATTAPAEANDQAKALAMQEEVRRQEMEVRGLKSLEQGYKELTAGNFQAALKQFDDALNNLPDRPKTVEARQKAQWGHAEADYRIALDIFRKHGNLQEARQSDERALKLVPEHKAAQALLRKIEREEEIAALPVPPKKRPDLIKKEQSIEDLIKQGKQYYDLGDYNTAEALFDEVLIKDEYNVDAMRFLKRIEETRFKISSTEREATVAGMMNKVREAWNPPIREEVKLPEVLVRGSTVETKTGAQKLQTKMANIMIPSIEFRQANITDVINFLVEASISGDKEEGVGVNIILNLNMPGEEGVTPSPAVGAGGGEEFGDLFGGSGAAGGAAGAAPAAVTPSQAAQIRTITLNLRRISLLDAIKYITEVAGLKYRLEENAVIITPAGVVSGRVITRMYPVQPSILDVIITKEEKTEGGGGGGGGSTERGGKEFVGMETSRTSIKKSDVKEFFIKAGVPFPVGTSITYNPSISQLIVANTPENLEIFERILSQLNVVPNQVEIEARFVEVSEDALEELGLQWILTDNYEFATQNGPGAASTLQRVQVNADNQGLTKGLRFFNYDPSTATVIPASPITAATGQSPLGGILTIASVLTNPELKMIVQALSQKGNSDLLSAPRVTTRSGVAAQIQVVKEIIYPTEFEVTQPTMSASSSSLLGSSALVTPPTVTPGSFETRETGVILSATPTVGPDGYTIDLTLVPEVAELVDWIQYGSTITTGGQTFTYNIPQPVFSSRNATTSIVIWDGQTVVMGGMISEQLTTFKDKIPILGDIPFLGRLFRSEGQQSTKVNLLIFVTARLVDPAGKPIHKAENMTLPGHGAAGGEATPAAAQ